MSKSSDIIHKVRQAFKKKVIFSRHALKQMTTQDRMIRTTEVYEIIKKGELIEDYPDDPRGHSCLIGGRTKEKRDIHVNCSPKEDHLLIITVYPITPEFWIDLKHRR